MSHCVPDLASIFSRSFLLLLVGLLFAATAPPIKAQTERAENAFYTKFGVGFSEYTGDLPRRYDRHLFDLRGFTGGTGFPVFFGGELGYQFSPAFAFALGVQAGAYPFAGWAGGPGDQWRYTTQFVGRYTFGQETWTVAPYVDAGANVGFGGDTGTGYGPSVGAGLDILLSRRVSFYVKSRFNLTFPDNAVDGADFAPHSFDLLNQLLGFGLKVNFAAATAPQVAALDGPAEVQTGERVTFTASVNEGEVTRPVTYRWQFGDGTTGSGLTASHAYQQPGTYTVTFTASNDAGQGSESLTVEAEVPPEPARISSVTASPNPVDAEKPVRFGSDVQGEPPLEYAWRFGDGSTGTGPSPSHTYEKPGQYTTRLKASNEAGTDSSMVSVRVLALEKGWTIVVASIYTEDMTEEAAKKEAETVAKKYRNRFSSESLSVQITTTELEERTRHRVTIGQFENLDAAYEALKKYEETLLPSDAWLLPLLQ